MTLEFANSAAKLCLDKYDSMKKTGKPGTNEWTVLAGIIMKKEEVLSLVSLATGTKCLSGIELVDSKFYDIGDRLSDSHAEILARRGFLLFLYDQIDLLLSSGTSNIFLMNTNESIEIKPAVSFHFYCSQTPCGDCSIIPLNQGETLDSSAPRKKPKLRQEIETEDKDSGPIIDDTTPIGDIHRTGAKCLPSQTKKDLYLPGIDYHVTGPLRTKPGRGDPTLSLSCSDKIAKWNAIGIQGSLLSTFMPSLRLETIVIGGGCPYSQEAMERGLYKRFGNGLAGPNVLQVSVPFSHSRNSTRSHPCPSSILWCAVRNRNTEIIVNGRKQGATKKKRATGPIVSRRNFLRIFLNTLDKCPSVKTLPLHPKKINYYHCKKWCDAYQREWRNLKATKFLAWPEKPAILQDFTL